MGSEYFMVDSYQGREEEGGEVVPGATEPSTDGDLDMETLT